MPAALPGDTAANNTGAATNPATGRAVLLDPLSGPKGSPLDFDNFRNTITGPTARASGNASTGALSTGIGFGTQVLFGVNAAVVPAQVIANAGFNDNDIPGYAHVTGGSLPAPFGGVGYAAPPPNNVVSANPPDSRWLYIGGGASKANTTSPDKFSIPFTANYYNAGAQLLNAGSGNGGTGEASRTGSSRDAGAGPAFTGFGLKTVTATGPVATGAAIETGFVNRTGIAMVSGQSAFGSASAASAAPATA